MLYLIGKGFKDYYHKYIKEFIGHTKKNGCIYKGFHKLYEKSNMQKWKPRTGNHNFYKKYI